MQVKLSYEWNMLVKQLGCQAKLSSEAFAVIVDCYESAERSYHSLNHLAVCLTELAAVREYCEQVNVVELALWFHDIVYVPSSNFNEELSAAVGSHYALTLTQNVTVASRVHELVLATKHQETGILDKDTQYLLDIDLAILGYPASDFMAYSAGIRREYSHLSDEEYKAGRQQVLQAFLNKEFIYHTEYFRQKYEQSARKNISEILVS